MNILQEDLAAKLGYPLESHTVVTDDGYILIMHRVPYSPKNRAANISSNSTVAPIPVLMLHPLVGTSIIYLFSPTNSPGIGPDYGEYRIRDRPGYIMEQI